MFLVIPEVEHRRRRSIMVLESRHGREGHLWPIRLKWNGPRVRSQEEKWRVPESDPAGHVPGGELDRLKPGAEPDAANPIRTDDEAWRAQLIYCGLCGALNPGSNYFCAACGTTLVDAFHASEGLRVYDKADTASRLIEIVPAGSELDIVDDPDASDDYVRVKLTHGRLGYIRLQDVAALANATPATTVVDVALGRPDINTNARGCVTQTGALGALLLMIVLSSLIWLFIAKSDSSESGIMALAACVTVGPLLIVTIGLYIFARSRDERLEFEAEEAFESAKSRSTDGN